MLTIKFTIYFHKHKFKLFLYFIIWIKITKFFFPNQPLRYIYNLLLFLLDYNMQFKLTFLVNLAKLAIWLWEDFVLSYVIWNRLFYKPVYWLIFNLAGRSNLFFATSSKNIFFLDENAFDHYCVILHQTLQYNFEY